MIQYFFNTETKHVNPELALSLASTLRRHGFANTKYRARMPELDNEWET